MLNELKICTYCKREFEVNEIDIDNGFWECPICEWDNELEEM